MFSDHNTIKLEGGNQKIKIHMKKTKIIGQKINSKQFKNPQKLITMKVLHLDLWRILKAFRREERIALTTHIRREERLKIKE